MFNPADDNAPRVYSPEPETSPAKTFKACRHCRRLKMRCEGNGIPPCQRCAASGAECVYDAIESSKKRKRAEEEILREEIRTLQRHVASLNEARLRPITSYLQTVVDTYTSNTPEQSGNDPDSRAESELSPEQLSAPVSTVHDLASTPRASSGNVHYIHSGDHSTEHLRNMQEAELAPSTDVVTKFSIKEDEARRLFHIYMTGSNPYLPFFEPTLDTFDRIRRSSPFLFASILSVATRTDGTGDLSRICHEEANRLAAESLFINPATLETAQALLILAAWSEKSWFALSHAVNVALDLGIDDALHRLAADSTLPVAEQNRLSRETRTWLIIYHLEREIAFGTARKSRLVRIEEEKLRLFHGSSRFRHLDLRFLSILDLVQLREKWQMIVRDRTNIATDATSLVKDAKESFDSWEKYWAQQHEDHEYDIDSFQRASLNVQRNYATILVYCAILSELQRQKSGGGRLVLDAFRQLSQTTLEAVANHLKFITNSSSYKWQLRFSPTYSALTIAFSAALALTLAKNHPNISREKHLVSISQKISRLLAEYPNQKFHLMVESFLKRMARASQTQSGRATAEGSAAPTTSTSVQPYDENFTEVTSVASLEFPGRQSLNFQSNGAIGDLDSTGLFSPPDSFQDKELEAILGLSAESWFLDPFSVEGFNFSSA